VKLQLLQLSIVLVLWFRDFLFGALSLEKDVLSWLSIGSSVACIIIISSKGYGACGCLHAYGWVTIVILSMVKMSTSNILTGYGPTLFSEQSNR